jgi:uncharacterized membrane protein
MVSVDSTSVRRCGSVAIAAAVVLTALALTNAEPARAAAQPAASETGASARDDMAASRQGKNGVGIRTHGFIRDANGVLTTIDVPRAGSTQANSTNERGQSVGVYVDRKGRLHGFLRDINGEFTTLDFPGAEATVASRINSQGQIVGAYGEDSDAPDSPHGFLFENGAFTPIDVPGAVRTHPRGINHRGQIIGVFRVRGDVQ